MTDLNWKSVSGYIIGRSHVSYGEPCQDRAINFDNGELKGIVVSDGAGSCKYSEQGAIAVTNAIANISTSQFTEWYEADNTAELMESYLLEVLYELQAQKEGSTLLDFSSTLLMVVIKDNRYLAAHVGDGVICQRVENEISVLSHPENGRYANETYFVTMTPLREHFRVYKGEMNKPHDFIAMTDGAAISFYINSKKEMELTNTTMLFEHLTENAPEDVQAELPEFLKLLQRNTTDDCAVAILVSHEYSSNEDEMVEGQVSPSVSTDYEEAEEQAFDDEEDVIIEGKTDDLFDDDDLFEDDLFDDDEEEEEDIVVEGKTDDPFDDDYDDDLFEDDFFDDDDYEDADDFGRYDEDPLETDVTENSETKVLPRQAKENNKTLSSQTNKIDSITSEEKEKEKTSQPKVRSQELKKKKLGYVSLNHKVKATSVFKLLPKR